MGWPVVQRPLTAARAVGMREKMIRVRRRGRKEMDLMMIDRAFFLEGGREGERGLGCAS